MKGNFSLIIAAFLLSLAGLGYCSSLPTPAGQNAVAGASNDSMFPDFADSHTVGLWLFDEPQYFHMTLTDASENDYDLRLDRGAMVPGRFGKALRVFSEDGPAVSYAYKGTHYDRDPSVLIDARPVEPPEKLLETLRRGEWTWEFWLKLNSVPRQESTILELGSGDTPSFQCDLAAGAKAFLLRSQQPAFSLLLPTDANKLGDNAWHHVAFTRAAGGKVQLFLDGQIQPTSQLAPSLAEAKLYPGLIGTIYVDREHTRRIAVRTSRLIDFYWGYPRDMYWAERWRGFIKAPFTRQVVLQVESGNHVEVRIGNDPVIDTGIPNNDRATISLVQGRTYPIQVDFEGGQGRSLRLSWSWPGHEKSLVPAEALWYTDSDRSNAESHLEESAKSRFYFSLGSGRFGGQPLDASLDEMRVSNVVRYGNAFTPGSFSRNYGAHPPKPAVATGPPLLFVPGAHDPFKIGSRKYVFIDGALLAKRQNLNFQVNPPTEREVVDLKIDKPWEMINHTDEVPAGVSPWGDCSVYEYKGEIRFMYSNSAMWADPAYGQTEWSMAVSRDGIHFHKPILGNIDWHGNQDNNIILKAPVQGRFFEDPNPAAPPEERFKMAGFMMQRGVYLFVSPDGIHWRRNETIMLPFDEGGGSEMFWDDQAGDYKAYLRHEGWAVQRSVYVGRSAALAQTREITRPWPFTPVADPAVFTKASTLPSLTAELPIPFRPNGNGHVYRTRAEKYLWAPDTYVAFVWRLTGKPPDDWRQSELAVSRDGEHWKFYEKPMYIPAGFKFNDVKAKEALSVNGLIRRGDEIWQYVIAKAGGHTEGTASDRIIRLKQRLDGFVSLDAGEDMGETLTRPLIFTGSHLVLNVKSSGSVRVGLLDDNGQPIPGFSVADCEPIRADSIRETVRWHKGSDVSSLAGKVVQVKFEMQNAKLYAFQFE